MKKVVITGLVMALEKAPEAIDVVQLTRQRRRQIETEAVDVHLLRIQ
jgi:hypothetical protein